jgi:hypothetical protein
MGIGFVLNMDECLNDDDDEEHHRVFFDCFNAQHERLPVLTGSKNPRVNTLLKEPACRTAWREQDRTPCIPVPARAYAGWSGR